MPRRRMIQVTVRGGVPAARRGARGVAGGYQVAEFAAGPVAALGLGVLAGAADDGVEFQGAGVGGPFGVAAGGAGVRGGGPVGVQHGVAPPGGGVPGRGGEQVAGGFGVQQPESAGVAGGVGGGRARCPTGW